MFNEAMAEWIPTLSDIIHRQNDGDDIEYYSQFGFDKLDFTGCPILTSMKDRLTLRFNEKYYDYKINSETMERWQIRLQVRADSVNPKYERAFRLYTSKADEIDADLMEKTVTDRTYGRIMGGSDTNSASGTDSSTNVTDMTNTADGDTKNIDTPDSIVNADDKYADSLSKSHNVVKDTGSVDLTTTYGRSDTTTYGQTENITDKVTETKERDGGFLSAVNANIDAWRDLESKYINEYMDNFLQIFWY